jgi:hypothetical protein
MFTQRRHSLSAPVECALLLLSLSVPALGFQVKLSCYHARPGKFFALRAIDRLSFETRSVQAIVMGSAREWPVFPPETLVLLSMACWLQDSPSHMDAGGMAGEQQRPHRVSACRPDLFHRPPPTLS